MKRDKAPIVRKVSLPSTVVPSPVTCDVIEPAGWLDEGAPGPLIIALHGGSGGNGHAALLAPLFARAWRLGELDPCTVVVPHSGRSFRIDDVRGDQQWERFILGDLVDGMGAHAVLDGRVALLGISMGGLGVLRLALKHPHHYVAAAALEPAMTWGEVDLRSTGVA